MGVLLAISNDFSYIFQSVILLCNRYNSIIILVCDRPISSQHQDYFYTAMTLRPMQQETHILRALPIVANFLQGLKLWKNKKSRQLTDFLHDFTVMIILLR